MKICLVRTGQTAWDAEERVRGKMDVPLTEAGRHAAATAAAALTGVGLEAVYCAPDEAARATADLLAKALDLSPRRLEALAGIDFGLWAGMSWAEVAQRHPKAYRHLMEAPLMVRPPGGESIDEALRPSPRAEGPCVPRVGTAASKGTCPWPGMDGASGGAARCPPASG